MITALLVLRDSSSLLDTKVPRERERKRASIAQSLPRAVKIFSVSLRPLVYHAHTDSPSPHLVSLPFFLFFPRSFPFDFHPPRETALSALPLFFLFFFPPPPSRSLKNFSTLGRKRRAASRRRKGAAFSLIERPSPAAARSTRVDLSRRASTRA